MQYLATTGPTGLGLENGRNFHLRWLLQFSKYGTRLLKIHYDNNLVLPVDLTKRVVTGGTFWCVCLAHDFLYLKTLLYPQELVLDQHAGTKQSPNLLQQLIQPGMSM